MKNIWKKYKAAMILFGYASAAILLFWLAFLPYISHIKSRADEIQAMELDNQIFEKKTSKITEMESKYDEYQNSKNKMGRFLKEGEEIDFIKRLEFIGEETKNKVNLRILDADAQNAKSSKNKPKEPGLIDSLPSKKFLMLEVNVVGGYSDLISFLRKIENLDFYTNVISLDMSKTVVPIVNAGSENAVNIFTPTGQNPPEVKKEKEALKGIINLIVYKN